MERLDAVAARFHTGAFPTQRIRDYLGPLVTDGLLSLGTYSEPDPSYLDLTLATGEELTLELDNHGIGGYQSRRAAAVSRFLEALPGSAEAQAGLADPRECIAGLRSRQSLSRK